MCSACIHELPWNTIACKQCAVPLEEVGVGNILCGQCLSIPPAFEKTYAAFVYQPPIIQLIAQLKFNQHLTCAAVLSELLLMFLQTQYRKQNWPQAIIPVPLHPRRLAERGYNQANELAKPLGKTLKIPVYFDLYERVKETPTQTAASARERRINLKNAFALAKPHTLKHIAILDDVLTTGSTVSALSHALKCSGVKCIDVWAIAKTIPILYQPNAMIKTPHQ